MDHGIIEPKLPRRKCLALDRRLPASGTEPSILVVLNFPFPAPPSSALFALVYDLPPAQDSHSVTWSLRRPSTLFVKSVIALRSFRRHRGMRSARPGHCLLYQPRS